MHLLWKAINVYPILYTIMIVLSMLSIYQWSLFRSKKKKTEQPKRIRDENKTIYHCLAHGRTRVRVNEKSSWKEKCSFLCACVNVDDSHLDVTNCIRFKWSMPNNLLLFCLQSETITWHLKNSEKEEEEDERKRNRIHILFLWFSLILGMGAGEEADTLSRCCWAFKSQLLFN